MCYCRTLTVQCSDEISSSDYYISDIDVPVRPEEDYELHAEPVLFTPRQLQSFSHDFLFPDDVSARSADDNGFSHRLQYERKSALRVYTCTCNF